MWSTYAQTLAPVPRLPQLQPHAVDARPHSSQPGMLRERTRPRRPSRIQRRTTPRLKSQNKHLPQSPQSPISANHRGLVTSWPFVAASTCPHDPVNTAPALTYLFNHDLLPRTVRTMKMSPPRANSYDGRADLCASFHRQATNWGHRRTTSDAKRPAWDGFGQVLRNVHWERQLIFQRAGVYSTLF